MTRTGALIAIVLPVLLACLWLARPAGVCPVYHEGRVFHAGEILGTVELGQEFTFPWDNLNRIDVFIGAFGGWSTGPVELKLGLVDPAKAPSGPADRFRPGGGDPLILTPGWQVRQIIRPVRNNWSGLNLLVRSGPARGKLTLTLASVLHPDRILVRLESRLADWPTYGWLKLTWPPLARSGGRLFRINLKYDGPEDGSAHLFQQSFFQPAGPDRPAMFPADQAALIVIPPDESAPSIDRIISSAYIMKYPDQDSRRRLGLLAARPIYPRPPETGPIVRRTRAESFWFTDNSFQSFRFDPLPDSAGRRFFFDLSAPQAAHGNAVTAWVDWAPRPDDYITQAGPPPAGLRFNGAPMEGRLTFRAWRQATKAEAAGLLAKRLSRDKRFGLGLGWTIGLALVIQILALGWLIMTLTGRRAGTQKETDSDD